MVRLAATVGNSAVKQTTRAAKTRAAKRTTNNVALTLSTAVFVASLSGRSVACLNLRTIFRRDAVRAGLFVAMLVNMDAATLTPAYH
jgi:hypothetical protein